MLVENDTGRAPAIRKRGRPVSADSERTRHSIVSAAREIIAERGYQAATFQQIAARAELSRPTLHYYFATRDDLYAALLSDLREKLDACAAEATRAGMLDAVGGLRRRCSSPPGSTALATAVHAFYDVVVDAVLRGELRADTDAHSVADMLGAVFWGVGFHAGFIGGDDSAEIARQLLSCLAYGLLDSHRPVTVGG